MPTLTRFPAKQAAAIDAVKYLGIRSGAEHRFIAVWVVVVNGRVLVRSWNDKPTGWYRAFLQEPDGQIQVGERTVRVRARKVRGERLLDAMEDAYRDKYPTPGSRIFVVGFRRARRRAATLELLPR